MDEDARKKIEVTYGVFMHEINRHIYGDFTEIDLSRGEKRIQWKITPLGSISSTRFKKMSIKLLRMSKPLGYLVLRRLLNPWHGGQPTTTETSHDLKPQCSKMSYPVMTFRSPQIGSSPRFFLYVLQAEGSISTAAKTLKPAFFRPKEAPPAPENKSIAVCEVFTFRPH